MKKTLTAEEVLDLCYNIHRNPDDFVDGDIEERINRAEEYELININPNELDDEWAIDEDLVEKYMDMSPNTVPPIVLHRYAKSDYSIVDGSNRVESFKRKGLKSIPAYIGRVKR